MSRLLVQVQELPARDGVGRIELTWRESKRVQRAVQTLIGSYRHADVESFTSTEILTYRDQEERARLLRAYRADAVAT